MVADVEVTECLQRPFDVRPCSISVPNLGFADEQCRNKVEGLNDDDEEQKMQSVDEEVLSC